MAISALLWFLAWSAISAAMAATGALDSPPRGPLWLVWVVGCVAWAVAGAGLERPATEMRRRRMLRAAACWGAAFALAAGLASILVPWFESHRLRSFSSAGFLGLLIAAGCGGALGAGAQAWLRARSDRLAGLSALLVGGLAGVTLVLFSWVGVVLGYLASQPVKLLLRGLLGDRGYLVGWGLGHGVAGMLVGVVLHFLLAPSDSHRGPPARPAGEAR